MRTTKFYRVRQSDQGKLTSLIISSRSLPYHQFVEVIGIIGKTPSIGDKIKLKKFLNANMEYGTVTQVSATGIPVQAQLDDGQIIELVGYLIQLVNLIEAIVRTVKKLFQKQKI